MSLACQHHSRSRHYWAIITIITIPIIITIIIIDAICLYYSVIPISILTVTAILKNMRNISTIVILLS